MSTMRPSVLRPLCGALAVALLAACPAVAPNGGPKPGKTAAPDRAKPGAEASATARPASAAPSPAAPSPAAGLASLVAPKNTVALAGTINLDAGYAVQAGAARVLSNAGASAVAFADAALIANNAGNLVANNAGNVVANHGAEVLAAWGAGIISDKGAGIISDKGAGLVANNSAGIISDKGAGYALADLPARRLFQASLPVSPPAVGEILPGAGMLVGVADLRTGELVPIGEDPAGKPVYGVYSDSAGRYTLHLPADATANVVVVAVPPTSETIDRRLALDLITAPRGDQAALDEDTALVSRFMRAFLIGWLANAIQAPTEDAVEITSGAVGAAVRDITLGFFAEVNREAAAVGLRGAARPEAERVARRISDVVLAHVDLPGVMIRKELATNWAGPPTPAVPVMVQILKETREKATEKLRANPDFFKAQPYLVAANAKRPAADAYVIAKPGDIGDFIVREFLLTADEAAEGVDAVFNSVGVGTTMVDGQNSRRRDFEAGTLGIGAGILGALLENRDGAHDEAIGVIKAWKPAP